MRFYIILLLILFFLSSQLYIIKKVVLHIGNKTKEKITHIKNDIDRKIKFFSDQQNRITALQKENKILNDKLAKCNMVLQTCKDLKYFKKLNLPDLYFVQTVSYAALPDFSQIYISYPKKISSPKGLVYNNLAAGIAVKNYGDYSLAYLNQNPKVSYSVMIGKNEIPGIFYGGEMIIKYINKFAPVKEGDIVKTSGLDRVFYKGALVGVVKRVYQKRLYQEAVIKPFYTKGVPDFFYVVDFNNSTPAKLP